MVIETARAVTGAHPGAGRVIAVREIPGWSHRATGFVTSWGGRRILC